MSLVFFCFLLSIEESIDICKPGTRIRVESAAFFSRLNYGYIDNIKKLHEQLEQIRQNAEVSDFMSIDLTNKVLKPFAFLFG